MAEIDEKSLKKIQELLNNSISNLLYGGSSDAGWGECEGAASCFETLKLLGLEVDDEESIRLALEIENIHNENFIKGL